MGLSFFLILLVVIAVFLVSLFLLAIYIRSSFKKIIEEKDKDRSLEVIKESLDSVRKSFEIGYGKINQELGRIREIGHMMKDFQDFFKSPKLRGNIGERILQDLLEEVLPKNNFKIQYKFREGQIVDAIIKTNQGIIPIDSKFPMESFRRMISSNNDELATREFLRDIKKHIDSISKKYILPQEGTVDFAMMYVPSESVYYEIVVNQPDLVDYAAHKKIYIISPNNFYYFLKTVMLGLQGAKIEEASKRIFEGLKGIKEESIRMEEELNVLISHINHAKSASERVSSRLLKLSGKIDRLSFLGEEKKEKLKEKNY